MRRCRKMISLIMLMVMLVSLLPSGALAAEPPTGEMTETTAVEEPQGDMDVEAVEEPGNEDSQDSSDASGGEAAVPEDPSEGASDSDVSQEPGEITEDIQEEAGGAATTSEVAAEVEPSENAGAGQTVIETAPAEELVEKEAKAASSSLDPYVTSIEITKGNQPVPRVDGGYVLDPGTYRLVLKAYSKGILPGTYTYTLPSEFTYKTIEGDNTIKVGSTTVATVSVAGNVLTVDFNENINNQQDVSLSIGFNMTVKYINGKTVYIDEVPIKVNPSPTPVPVLTKGPKGASQDISKSTAGDGYYHTRWTITVTCASNVSAAGMKVTDNAGSNSHYADYDKNTGIKVTAKKGSSTAVWTLKEGSSGFSWSGSKKWEYTIPAQAPSNASSGAGTALGPDWDFTFEFTTAQTVEWRGGSKDVQYWNGVTLYDTDGKTEIDSVNTYANRTPGVTSIGKTGNWITENGEYEYMHWTVTVTIKNSDTSDYWSVTDRLKVKGNENDTTLPNDDIPKAEDVSATITIDGTTENVPVQTSSAAPSETSDSGYYIVHTGRNHFYLRNVNYGAQESGVSGDARLVIDYKQKLTTAVREKLREAGSSRVFNFVWLNEHDTLKARSNHALSYQAPRKRIVTLPTKNNNYMVSFNIRYLPEDDSVSGYEYITVEDQMSNTLSLLQNTIVISAGKSNGETETLSLGTDYDYEYSNHKLVIKIYDPHTYVYNIDYSAIVTTDPKYMDEDGNIQYFNEATAVINGKEAGSLPAGGTLVIFGDVRVYQIIVNKVDENGSKPLPGAKVAIFYENGRQMKQRTTDAQGKADFHTNVEEEIIYSHNVPYYVQEVEAPANYKLDTTKHWFVISDETMQNVAEYHDDDYWEGRFSGIEIIHASENEDAQGLNGSAEFTIENKAENISIPVQKVWSDENDKDGIRPGSVEIKLLANTVETGQKLTLNESNLWKGTFTDLPKNDGQGRTITYTVSETEPAGYTVTISGDETKGFTVTNKHIPEVTSATVKKVWNDKNNQDGKRPTSLKVTLSNGTEVTLNEANSWTATVDNLPKYNNGVEIEYSWTEDEAGLPEGYSLTATDKNGTITTLTNTYDTEVRSISVTKAWKDDNDMDKRQPVEITVQLYANGAELGDPVTVKESDGWKYTWTGLDKFKDGNEITYTVDEVEVPDGYEKVSIDGGMTTGYIITNKHDERPVSISKVDITSGEEVAGATLQILNSEGKVVTAKDEEGNDFECTWTSTTEPKVIYGLTPGTVYTLHEEIQPDGYTIAADTTFTIIVNEEGEFQRVESSGTVTENNVVLVKDSPTKVNVRKVDAANDKELPGATLQILDEEENVVVIEDNDGTPVETLEWVSGEKPKYIEGLPTGVNYILRETISPDGYTIASDTKFTIDEKGVVTSDGTTSTAEDGTTVLVVEDDLTTVQISKVDTESGAELEGAKLQIIDEEGKVVEEWTSTKEVHIVRGLVAGKKYILREQVAPLGYTLTSDTTFSIDMHNVVTSTGPVNKDGVILVNDTMTEVEILKVDSKTGKGLAGAKLQVLDDNGAVCDEWKSTKDAHKIRGLYTGVKYTLHEVEAPKGYDKAKDITFTIDTAGKVSSDALDNGKIVMKDTPTPKKNKTGDEANGSLWALLLMMASGALGGTVWFKRRRRA